MPAKSVAQRRFFGMLEHNPGMAKARGVNMTKEQMHDFAATPEKNLPAHAPTENPAKRLKRRTH